MISTDRTVFDFAKFSLNVILFLFPSKFFSVNVFYFCNKEREKKLEHFNENEGKIDEI